MNRAVLTGFEPFGSYSANPTEWLALKMDRTVLEGFQVNSLVFPSTVVTPQGKESSGEVLARTAAELDADLAISFGMASEVRGFRLERTGTNWISNSKYCSADENERPLEPCDPPKRKIQADLSAWDMNEVRKHFADAAIPLESAVSDDAGQYSCNGLIYRALRAIEKQRRKFAYLFVHTACTEEAISDVPDFDRTAKTVVKKEEFIGALSILLRLFRK